MNDHKDEVQCAKLMNAQVPYSSTSIEVEMLVFPRRVRACNANVANTQTLHPHAELAFHTIIKCKLRNASSPL